MKKILALLLTVFLSINAQQKLKPVGNDVHDFGKITKGSIVKHTFQLKNISNQTITIERVQSSCGCTAALISKKVLKPNQIAKITAEFNSQGFQGFQEKHIYVYEKNNPNPIYTLTIKANVFVELKVVPMYMVFDNAIVGVDKQSIVQIINRTDKKVRILKIENPYENLQLKIDKNELMPGDFATIQGTFTPTVSGLIRGSFTIYTDASQKKIEIKFYSNVKDKL
jgi:hypothetical protein